MNHKPYNDISKIVIANLKEQCEALAARPINWVVGDDTLTSKQYKKALAERKRKQKGAQLLLEACELLKI